MNCIPLSKPYFNGDELNYLQDVLKSQELVDGKYTKLAQEKLQSRLHSPKVLLTNSCTSALEMAALLTEIKLGDEIIMPSFTFPSTANAFVLRGATPVFVDIRPDTLNLNECAIEAAITSKTRAIVPMHYGGIACAMNNIMAIAKQKNLWVIEDAAQTIGAFYQQKPLGSFGALSALSFHATKNIASGVGGCLCINDERLTARAEILYQKGTNRNVYLRGEVDRYTWVDVGSSFIPSELTAALLCSQLEKINDITTSRLSIWKHYHHAFEEAENRSWVKRPLVFPDCQNNGHMYYLLMPNRAYRDRFIEHLNRQGIQASFHFIPLHSSPAGLQFGKISGNMRHTDAVSERIIRLPLWYGLEPYVEKIITIALDTLERIMLSCIYTTSR